MHVVNIALSTDESVMGLGQSGCIGGPMISNRHAWLVSVVAMRSASQSGWLSQTSYLHEARVGVGAGSQVCRQSHDVKWAHMVGVTGSNAVHLTVWVALIDFIPPRGQSGSRSRESCA